MNKKTAVSQVTPSARDLDITKGILLPEIAMYPADAQIDGQEIADWSLYRDVFRDSAVQTSMMQLVGEINARSWQVLPGEENKQSQAAADEVKEWLAKLSTDTQEKQFQLATTPSGFDAITAHAVWGIIPGYFAAEVVYHAETWAIKSILSRDFRRFLVDGEYRLILQTATSSPGEKIPAGKMWFVVYNALHSDAPYGFGLAPALKKLVDFKNEVMRLWEIFLASSSSQTYIGALPTSLVSDCITDPQVQAANQARIDQYSQSIESLANGANATVVFLDSGVSIDQAIKALPSVSGGDPGYQVAIEWANSQVYKLILGQDATVIGTPGALGNQDTRESMLDKIATALADIICDSFNTQVVAPWCEVMHPSAVPPRVWRVKEENEDLGLRSQRDAAIMALVGKQFTPEYVSAVYGEDYEKAFSDVPPPVAAPEKPQFSEVEMSPQEKITAGAMPSIADAFGDTIEAIRVFLANVADDTPVADVKAGLDELFSDLPKNDLSGALEAAYTLAMLAGYGKNNA